MGLKIDILTLFPDMFTGPFDESIIARAKDKNLVEIKIHALRDWGLGTHKTVDDRPYGGGVGMILRVDVVSAAITNLQLPIYKKTKTVLLDAGGQKFTQAKAQEYSKLDHLILIAGHYEGVDYRVHEHLVDDVISIGDYVLTGGELPAMVITDCVARLIPGVLAKPEAAQFESFSNFKLEHPHYTRPEEFNGWKVPEILLTGHHENIDKWREERSVEKTKKVRPDLG